MEGETDFTGQSQCRQLRDEIFEFSDNTSLETEMKIEWFYRIIKMEI